MHFILIKIISKNNICSTVLSVGKIFLKIFYRLKCTAFWSKFLITTIWAEFLKETIWIELSFEFLNKVLSKTK